MRRSDLLRAWIAVVALLVAAPPPAEAGEHDAAVAAVRGALAGGGADAALLLGLRHGDDYRTLLLARDGGKLRLAAERPGLVTPQKRGFWQLGPVSVTVDRPCGSETCRFRATDVWASASGNGEPAARMRIGKRLASLAGKATPGMSLDSTTRIDYVATGTVCISVEESSEGGAHPSLFTAAHCIALAPELDPRDPLSLSDRLDAKELERVIAELRRTAEAGGFEEHRVAADLLAEVGPGDPDELPFRLAHREGRVEATALQYRKAPRFLSPSYHLTVTAPLPAPPRAFVAYAGDGALFARAHAADDAVLDTFVAPGREVAFVLVGGRIVGVSQENAAAVAELRDERVVMAEWATGGNVARWIAALGGK